MTYKLAVEYVYTSKKPNFKKEQSDLALEILVLAHGWLMTEAQNAMQDIMMRPKMVDPFNLDHGETFIFSLASRLYEHFFLLFKSAVLLKTLCRKNCSNIVLDMRRKIPL